MELDVAEEVLHGEWDAQVKHQTQAVPRVLTLYAPQV
jgi:hypothetical protein